MSQIQQGFVSFFFLPLFFPPPYLQPLFSIRANALFNSGLNASVAPWLHLPGPCASATLLIHGCEAEIVPCRAFQAASSYRKSQMHFSTCCLYYREKGAVGSMWFSPFGVKPCNGISCKRLPQPHGALGKEWPGFRNGSLFPSDCHVCLPQSSCRGGSGVPRCVTDVVLLSVGSSAPSSCWAVGWGCSVCTQRALMPCSAGSWWAKTCFKD